jgi:RHS repeat-associated protein
MERLSYDDACNVAQLEESGLDVQLFTYGAGSRLERRGSTRYLYDADGRLQRKTEDSKGGAAPREWQFTWTALDQLESVRTPTGEVWRYSYDALGRRIQKAGPKSTTHYIWNQDTIVHELQGRDSVLTWVYAPKTQTPLCELRDREIFSIVPDHHGTALDLVDAHGEVVSSCQYTLWGRVRRQSGSIDPCRLRFPGQWFDEETGLHYNRFRYYDPECGRFISPDPSRLAGGWNPYLYARNPLNWIDPYGLATVFRGMKRDSDGQPVVYSGPPTGNGQNNAADSIGLRPEEAGMSSGADPSRLPENRRPPEFDGTQRKKQGDAGMFGIDEDALAKNGLRLDPNDMDGNHRTIIPVEPDCPRDEFERRLAATRDDWKEMTPEEAKKRMEEEKAAEGCGVSE